MKQLLILGPPEIQSGIWKVGKAAGLLWEEGNNVVFRGNGVERVDGAKQQGELLTDQARDIVQAYIPATGAKRVYVATDISVEMYEKVSDTWTKTLLLVWPTAGQYADLETWGNWLVASNGRDPVRLWENGGAFNILTGTPFSKAQIIKRKAVFLLAFNTDNIGETGVEWSTDSDIKVWNPGVSRAGNYVIRDLESEIKAVEDLGDRLAVYSRNSLVIGTFVGGTNVWGWRRAIGGIGAVSSRSVVSLDPFNYGLTQDGIFKTDGNSFAFVDDPAMVRYIKDTADFSQQHLFWGVADNTLKCVSFNFLDINGSWHQVQYYPEKGFFTKGNFQLTAGAPKSVLDYPVIASEDLKLGTWQQGSKHFGTEVSFNLKTKPLDFGDRSVYKLLQMIRVDGKWKPGINIRVQELRHPEDPAPKTVIDWPLQNENYFERDARYFTVEFYGNTAWSLTGMEFFGLPGGVAL
jgi:hypothetical protein